MCKIINNSSRVKRRGQPVELLSNATGFDLLLFILPTPVL